MTTQTVANQASTVPMQSQSFERFAGLAAILTGLLALLYAIAFVVLKNPLLSAVCLLLTGLLSTAVLTAIYGRLRETDSAFALLGLLLGIAGAIGSAIHAGYDFANVINPHDQQSALIAVLPSPIDPRGLLTFGFAGLGLLVVAWLITRGGQFPRSLGYLIYLAGILLIVIYLGRLIVFDPKSPVILIPVVLAGFIVNPVWNIWLGLVLWRGRKI